MNTHVKLEDLEVGYDVPALPGMDEADIQTPCLVLDLDALEYNIKKMGDYAAAHNMRHRAHGKMHKSVDVLKLQMELGGAVGVCCQKVSEAEVFARAGIKEILVSNQVRDPFKINRLAQLPKHGGEIIVCVDDVSNVADLSKAAQKHGTQLGVFIDDFDLAALDFHAAVGGVLEAHLHTHAELLGVSGQRAGETGDMGNTDGIGRLRKRRGGEGGEREGRRGDETLHRNLSLIFRPDGRLVVVMVPFNMTPDSPFRKRVSKKIPQTWNSLFEPSYSPENREITGP